MFIVKVLKKLVALINKFKAWYLSSIDNKTDKCFEAIDKAFDDQVKTAESIQRSRSKAIDRINKVSESMTVVNVKRANLKREKISTKILKADKIRQELEGI